jgi:dTDP-4-amino-4,6-dideoxygalactose transaminase
MVMHDKATKQRIDYLKNFGFADEVTVVGPGINSKMDEVRAAYGILNLRQADAAIEARGQAAAAYRQALTGIEGIRMPEPVPGVRYNYAYFPIFIDSETYGMSRDELYAKMKSRGVYGRRYFYPLISTFPTYRGLESADPLHLPNAHRLADSVICLPMHHALSQDDIKRVIDCIVH